MSNVFVPFICPVPAVMSTLSFAPEGEDESCMENFVSVAVNPPPVVRVPIWPAAAPGESCEPACAVTAPFTVPAPRSTAAFAMVVAEASVPFTASEPSLTVVAPV